jgi:hypothetical protein
VLSEHAQLTQGDLVLLVSVILGGELSLHVLDEAAVYAGREIERLALQQPSAG